jgi:hypothetical protein
MQTVGAALLCGGLAFAMYYYTKFDTTVAVPVQ